MAQSAAATKAATEKKAVAAAKENKSEGLRLLFEADYTVGDAAAVLDVPYGFAYGVARRAGAVTPTPRTPKAAPAAKAAAPKASATKTAAAKVAPRAKASAAKSKTATKAKA